jgi:hypothetical protein
MTIQAPPCWERVGADLNMDAIFTMKGLSGAALFGAFFLLLRKRHSRTYSIISYGVMKALVCENMTI